MFQTNLIVLSKSLWLYQNKVCEKCQTFYSKWCNPLYFQPFWVKVDVFRFQAQYFQHLEYATPYYTVHCVYSAQQTPRQIVCLESMVTVCSLVWWSPAYTFFMALNVRSFKKVTWDRTDLYTAALMLHNTLPKYWLLAIMSRDGWHSQIYYNASTLQTLTELLYPRYRWVTGLSFYGNQSATHTGKMKIQLLLFRQTV